MRETLKPPGSPLQSVASQIADEDGDPGTTPKPSPYDAVMDPVKLRRLVTAREKTKASLEQRVAWVGMEQSGTEEAMTIVQGGPAG